MWKIKLKIIALLWLVWTINAAYLTNEAYKIKETITNFWGEPIWMVCDLNHTFSCSSVFMKDFAWILGFPFPAIALIVYPVIAIIAFLWLKWKINNPFKILLVIAIWGLLFNSYIIYNEYLVWVYCLLCIICAWIIITVWGLSIFWLKDKIINKKI